MPSPKVTLITVSLNSEKTIKKTIQSVLSQSYSDFEYLIVDGASQDATLSIAKSFQDKRLSITCEKDDGISDAMNRGLRAAAGEIIGIIHSDDEYAPGALETVMKVMENPSVKWVFGKILLQGDTPGTSFTAGNSYCPKQLEKFMSIPHPTVFCRREMYEAHGTFLKDYRLAMDYELCLRFAQKHPPVFIDQVLAKMSIGGVSTRSLKNEIYSYVESLRAKHSLLGFGGGRHLPYFFWTVFKAAVRRGALHFPYGAHAVQRLRKYVNPYVSDSVIGG